MTINERVWEIDSWLTRNGWTRVRQLPDHIAANVRLYDEHYQAGRSLADMVYELIEHVKENN